MDIFSHLYFSSSHRIDDIRYSLIITQVAPDVLERRVFVVEGGSFPFTFTFYIIIFISNIIDKAFQVICTLAWDIKVLAFEFFNIINFLLLQLKVLRKSVNVNEI